MLRILLNGEAREVAEDMTLEALLADQGLCGGRVAVEVNGEVVPRSRHRTSRLRDGDRVEVVRALGGG